MFGYLIDMDGVIYRENQLIPGAERFIHSLQEQDVPVHVPHQQQPAHPPRRRDEAPPHGHRRRRGARLHLRDGDRAVPAAQKPHGTAFVIGEGGLLNALHANGYSIVDRDPDYVVVGEGRTLNFEMVEAALQMILGGAKLVATNLDPNCPTAKGMRPGCGAIVAMLEAASGTKAFSVGKPSPS